MPLIIIYNYKTEEERKIKLKVDPKIDWMIEDVHWIYNDMINIQLLNLNYGSIVVFYKILENDIFEFIRLPPETQLKSTNNLMISFPLVFNPVISLNYYSLVLKRIFLLNVMIKTKLYEKYGPLVSREVIEMIMPS